jgi:arylsulfatase A-like enzyme
LPQGYREDDLDDLPPTGKRMGPNRYFAHIREHEQWKKGIQAYLASIHFADAMLGRVLDALEAGPHRDNTIVVLWSDHGWHLGEKQHWQKFTGWRVCDRVPLMVRVPKGAPGLPDGTRAGSICARPVNLVDLFATLTDLCGLPQKEGISDHSLVPLLKNPEAEWDHAAITQINGPDSYAISTKSWRLIHYSNGDEELYDIANDPHEWTNLLHGPTASDHAAKAAELRALAPHDAVPMPEVAVKRRPKLRWHSAEKGPAPASKPDGSPFAVVFLNESENLVELMWMDRRAKPKPYGTIEPGQSKSMQTRPGAVWMIRDLGDKELGHFRVGDRAARAVIED